MPPDLAVARAFENVCLFPQSLSLDFFSAFLVYFCLLSVSWQQEGKPKGGVLNGSLFKTVSPDLEQALVQRRASRSSVEGNTFRDYARINVRPESHLDLLNLHKAWA